MDETGCPVRDAFGRHGAALHRACLDSRIGARALQPDRPGWRSSKRLRCLASDPGCTFKDGKPAELARGWASNSTAGRLVADREATRLRLQAGWSYTNW
jgi:hypothetical protein